MKKSENNLPFKKQGKKLKIDILLAGFDTIKEFAEASGISYFTLRDYCCGKVNMSQVVKDKIKEVLKQKKSTPKSE